MSEGKEKKRGLGWEERDRGRYHLRKISERKRKSEGEESRKQE